MNSVYIVVPRKSIVDVRNCKKAYSTKGIWPFKAIFMIPLEERRSRFWHICRSGSFGSSAIAAAIAMPRSFVHGSCQKVWFVATDCWHSIPNYIGGNLFMAQPLAPLCAMLAQTCLARCVTRPNGTQMKEPFCVGNSSWPRRNPPKPKHWYLQVRVGTCKHFVETSRWIFA